MSEHVAELAELYALGTLDEKQRRQVDAHVQSCAPCAQRVGEAEAVVAELVAAQQPCARLDRRVRGSLRSRTPLGRLAPLLAAAFVLGLLPTLWFARNAATQADFGADRAQTIVALLHSHFVHTEFHPLAPDAPRAKVIYTRTASWCFVIAQTDRAYHLVGERDGHSLELGTLRVRAGTAELFVPATSARTLLLLDGTRPVARATLPYRP